MNKLKRQKFIDFLKKHSKSWLRFALTMKWYDKMLGKTNVLTFMSTG